MRKLVLILLSIGLLFLVACSADDEEVQAEDKESETRTSEEIIADAIDEAEANEVTETTEEIEEVEEVEEEIKYEDLTPEGKIIYNIFELMDEGRVFDAGSYIPGDIPEGEYIFSKFDGSGQYYAEKELNGNIIDNENFDSFGYVYVHGVGNIETGGVLISVDDLDEIEASGAKEIYEILNSTTSYKDSGYYKVGVDIDPGEYVIESVGRGYVAVMSGPVGNSDIVNNENIDGRFAVSVQEGQYLKVSGAAIAE